MKGNSNEPPQWTVDSGLDILWRVAKGQDDARKQAHRRTVEPESFVVDSHGFRWGGRPAPLSKTAELRPLDEEQVALARAFLAQCAPTKTRGIYSYGLKHTIENSVGHYITNGACIHAALDLGLTVKPEWERDSPNGWIYVSRKSVRGVALKYRGGTWTIVPRREKTPQ